MLRKLLILALGFILFVLSSCDSSDTFPPSPLNYIELKDPTPGAGDRFGGIVAILSNGNIIISDLNDSSVAPNNGAVHLYDPLTKDLIASIYGESEDDQLGSNGITVLKNNNYVISSPFEDEGGLTNVGSVILVDGTTGLQIGSTIVGDTAGDHLGYSGIAALANDNYVIASQWDNVGGLSRAGSVILVDGSTGIQIGSGLSGDTASDRLGARGIVALPNSNFVIASAWDEEGGIFQAGSVRLVDGETGIQIGSTLAGDAENDYLGFSDILVLANSNYVIASEWDDVNGIADAGSVTLMNGTTGIQIGSTFAGDTVGEKLGFSSLTAVANDNYVIASQWDNVGGQIRAGSVRLVDGSTGIQIGSTLTGDTAEDQLGAGSNAVTALANNNYVLVFAGADVGGIVNAGSVMLISGTTGNLIGNTIAGDFENNFLGASSITPLSNNNYVIASRFANENSIFYAGSVKLADGTTGAQIGATFAGNTVNDQLGDDITALTNNNFVIISVGDDVNGIVDAGSVSLVNGITGSQIGNTFAGDTESDELGGFGGVTGLANGNFLIATGGDDVNGIVNAGSVKLVDGVTGVELGFLVGEVEGDMFNVEVTVSDNNDFYIISQNLADNGGLVNSGLVRLIEQ